MANQEDTEIVELAAKAQSGDAEAQYNLAVKFINQSNIKIAEKWLVAAADQDHTEAQYLLGSLYLDGANEICKGYGVKYVERIENLLKRAAEKGHQNALIKLTPLYLTKGLPTYNLDVAAEWAPKAAATGDATSIFNLAELYREGKCAALGGEPNMEKYEELIKQAAEKKHPMAEYALGEIEEAKGTPEGDIAAFELYLDSGMQDYAPAQFKVAMCLYQGKGVEPDRELGEEWLIYVAEYGYEKAIEEIKQNPDYELDVKPITVSEMVARNRAKSKSKAKSKKKR